MLIAGVFWLFGMIYVVISIVLHNPNDFQMIKEELYDGVFPLFAITGGVIAIAMFANSWICDANFYSGYFEGDLDGRVDIKDLNAVANWSEVFTLQENADTVAELICMQKWFLGILSIVLIIRSKKAMVIQSITG